MPKENNFNTSFSFEYWTDGSKDANAPIWAKLSAHNLNVDALLAAAKEDSSGKGFMQVIKDNLVIVLVCGLGIVLICMVCCVMRCMRKNNKTGMDGELTPYGNEDVGYTKDEMGNGS